MSGWKPTACANRALLYQRARLRRGLSKARLADLADLSLSTIARLEDGWEISWEESKKLSKVLWP